MLPILVTGVLLLSACGGALTTAPPAEAPSSPTPTEQPTLTSKKWIEEVTNAWVVAHRHDWDADADTTGYATVNVDL